MLPQDYSDVTAALREMIRDLFKEYPQLRKERAGAAGKESPSLGKNRSSWTAKTGSTARDTTWR